MVVKRLKARVRVQITLEVCPTDTWGGDCTAEQIHKQGAESAAGMIRRAIEKYGIQSKVLMIGEPKTIAVLTEEDHA